MTLTAYIDKVKTFVNIQMPIVIRPLWLSLDIFHFTFLQRDHLHHRILGMPQIVQSKQFFFLKNAGIFFFSL